MAQAKDPAATEHFGDFTKMLEQFKLPGIDTAAFIEARRSDIVALTQANNVAYEGMQELLRKQAEILYATFEELWVSAEKFDKDGEPAVRAGQPEELIEQAVLQALSKMRELAEMAMKTQTEALAIIGQRAMQKVEEMKTLMHPR
jgi:phasin family protein